MWNENGSQWIELLPWLFSYWRPNSFAWNLLFVLVFISHRSFIALLKYQIGPEKCNNKRQSNWVVFISMAKFRPLTKSELLILSSYHFIWNCFLATNLVWSSWWYDQMKIKCRDIKPRVGEKRRANFGPKLCCNSKRKWLIWPACVSHSKLLTMLICKKKNTSTQAHTHTHSLTNSLTNTHERESAHTCNHIEYMGHFDYDAAIRNFYVRLSCPRD